MDSPKQFSERAKSDSYDPTREASEAPDPKEIFVYDRQYLSPLSTGLPKPAVPQRAYPAAFIPPEPPDTLSNESNLQAWQNLFKARTSWATDLTHKCALWSDTIQKHFGEINVIDRAVGVALENLQAHVRTLEQKFEEVRAWSQGVIIDQTNTLDKWEEAFEKLERIQAPDGFRKFFQHTESTARDGKSKIDLSRDRYSNLRAFIDTEDVKTAGSISTDGSRRFKEKFGELSHAVGTVSSNSQALTDKVSVDATAGHGGRSEQSVRLLEDMEAVAKKVNSDYHHVLGLPSSSKSISQVSRMALLHTRNYLPSLSESSSEMNQLLRQTVTQRNALASTAAQHMQSVSLIESRLAEVQPRLSAFDVDPEDMRAFDKLRLVIRIPVVYGCLLVECLRRREWNEKMKADSSTLAEEMAVYREDEERRRRKWLRNIGDIITTDSAHGRALGVEINLQGEEQPWPHVTRGDVQTFQDTLKGLGGMDDTVKEISQQLKYMSRPTRQQRATAKAFKLGSIHEAVLGRSSLLLRDDDEPSRSLRDEKIKLEDKLKGSESRVRKLEDLLHRHSQFGRPTSDNLFQPLSNQNSEQLSNRVPHQPVSVPSSPLDNLNRPHSVARRFSYNQGAEEKALARRVVTLEAELNSERERTAVLQKDASCRVEVEKDLQGRISDANSTKQDLMGNLEAQQREFADERKLLEEEMQKLKLRLEDADDELDKVLGSHENAKAKTDQTVCNLETELRKVRSDAAEEIQKAQGQTDFLRNDYTLQREKANRLERKSQTDGHEKLALQNKVRELEAQLHRETDAHNEHRRSLRVAHLHLSLDEMAPEELPSLIEAIEKLAERCANHQRDLDHSLAVIRADRDSLQSKANESMNEVFALREKLGAEEMESFSLRENLAEEKARISSLRSELNEERLQLSDLRSKFAEGETGAEALRDRVAEETSKVTEISGQLAASESRATSFADELKRWQVKTRDLETQFELATSRLESRSMRAKDISGRLYAQNDRLGRLLETLGFSITHRDDSMIVQRVSRTASVNTTENDPQSSMMRSISSPTPQRKDYQHLGDLNVIDWIRDEHQDIEGERYKTFVDTIGRFDLDIFSEAIAKRVKESEHLARKWQKEARAYRDKSHRIQNEAAEKIAFRSFKEGDLALFLPTRNQATRPWAAFNVGAPHFFLREQDSHNLRKRDWLLARISRVEERVVDLSRTISEPDPSSSTTNTIAHDRQSITSTTDSFDEENPFELSDGLRWYLLDAAEEKPGAPSTPGLGKSTVASANVDVKGSIRMKKSPLGQGGASKTLSQSLDSRRSSTNSKKGVADVASIVPTSGSAEASRVSTSAGLPTESGQDGDSAIAVDIPQDGGVSNYEGGRSEVRKDLLRGP
ncbi:MAG: oligomeric, coiled-coil, peripheral membrane protein [Candelina submexicana]|nr:MAG: oligomeric, coiled-coil, peripheral membrane protein [Candelina submexicana]